MTKDGLTIRLLGGFAVHAGNGAVPEGSWRLRKGKALVKLVALAPDRRLHRDQVAELLWPDRDARSAANNFHQALHAARRALDSAGADGAACLPLRDDVLALCPDGALEVDVDAFEAAAARARATAAPPTTRRRWPPTRASCCPRTASSPGPPRGARRRASCTSRCCSSSPSSTATTATTRARSRSLQRAVLAAPLHEAAHRALMRRLRRTTGAASRRSRSTRRCARPASASWRPTPTPRRARCTARSWRRHPSGPRAPPPTCPPPAHELHRARARARRARPAPRAPPAAHAHRPGRLRQDPAGARGRPDAGRGVRRRRLAGRAGRARRGPSSSPAAVAATAARPAGPRGDRGARSPRRASSGRGAAARARQLRAPHRRVRRPRRGACCAAAPACGCWPPAASRCASPARSRGASRRCRSPSAATAPWPRSRARRPPVCSPSGRRPDALDDENAPAVAELCHRLDGMPLAIELAAARAGVLSPAQIAERLDERLDVLGAGSRTAVTRQQTLRATLGWSHDLLDEEERILFRRLAVFAGGFAVEAAEAVAADEPLERAAVLDVLARLVSKSLVVSEEHDGAVRHRLLEIIRQYARERLERGARDPRHRGAAPRVVPGARGGARRRHRRRAGPRRARAGGDRARQPPRRPGLRAARRPRRGDAHGRPRSGATGWCAATSSRERAGWTPSCRPTRRRRRSAARS